MSFKSSPFWLTALMGSLWASSLQAADTSLTLSSGASVGVEVVETLRFDDDQTRQNDILLHATQASSASDALPEYCLLVATAQLNNDRIRITTRDATCIETNDAESAIYSGSFAASAYAEDGQYGLACDSTPCTIAPGQTFILSLDEDISISAQDNPSAEINATRRQAEEDDATNPAPAEQP